MLLGLENGMVVHNDTARLYRYFDATALATFWRSPTRRLIELKKPCGERGKDSHPVQIPEDRS